jgi:hypothetical protein
MNVLWSFFVTSIAGEVFTDVPWFFQLMFVRKYYDLVLNIAFLTRLTGMSACYEKSVLCILPEGARQRGTSVRAVRDPLLKTAVSRTRRACIPNLYTRLRIRRDNFGLQSASQKLHPARSVSIIPPDGKHRFISLSAELRHFFFFMCCFRLDDCRVFFAIDGTPSELFTVLPQSYSRLFLTFYR